MRVVLTQTNFKLVHHGVVVFATAQLHSSKPELRFCAGSNPARVVSDIRDGEDLWQWSWLEIRLRLSSVNHTTKTIYHHHHPHHRWMKTRKPTEWRLMTLCHFFLIKKLLFPKSMSMCKKKLLSMLKLFD